MVRGAEEGRSSRGSSMSWGWNIGVAQMCSKDTVDGQSEAHKLGRIGYFTELVSSHLGAQH